MLTAVRERSRTVGQGSAAKLGSTTASSAGRVVESVVRVSRPDPDLLFLGVLDDAEVVLRRNDRHPGGDLARVPHLVGTVRAGRKAHDVTRIKRLFTSGASDRHLARQRNQPLFVRPFEVVWADC